MFLLFDFIVLMDLTDFDCTRRLFYTHANKVYCVGEWGGVILNHPVPLSICLSEDEKFPDSNFKTPV